MSPAPEPSATCRLAPLLTLLLVTAATAQVRELGRLEGGPVLGTDRFSLAVVPTGALLNLKSAQAVLFPFVSLYTTPHSTTDSAPLRCCQRELPGLGDRPPVLHTSLDEGRALVTITRECSHSKAYDNAPLYTLHQTVLIEPSAAITVSYDCLFHRITRWSGFNAVLAGAMPAFQSRRFHALLPGSFLTGIIPDGLPHRNDTAGLWALTLDHAAGPVRVSFHNPCRVTLEDWSQYLALSSALPNLPHGGLYTYRGQRERFGFTIQLPVAP